MLIASISTKAYNGGFITITVSKLGRSRVPVCVIEGGSAPAGALIAAIVEVFPIVTAIDEDRCCRSTVATTT
ncbi:hypothetical protein N9187_05755, partial [Akkermansiaceae bacterium]|nr:hypothetical protein [Akkermansiaceae bacterium]